MMSGRVGVGPPSAPIAADARPPSWSLARVAGREVLALDGDWLGRSRAMPTFSPSTIDDAGGEPMGFDCADLGRWDSGLIAFLWDAKRIAVAAGRTLDLDGLPPAARHLLALLPDRSGQPPAPPRRPFRPLFRLGDRMVSLLGAIGGGGELLASAARATATMASGRARMRMIDLADDIRDAGPAALLIVGVVNFLVGAILAFIGAVQLRKFAADMYVANLVGLALVREMAAVMTGIVMAGRTGGAYAARIAAMRGGEEIDALIVFGIPVEEYVVLPAVLSLVLTMPFLYLYACAIGMVGGFIVSVSMLNVTAAGYLEQTLGAVSLGQFVFGFSKSVAFAFLIGIAGCRVGLRARRNAGDVGVAATTAVVVGIVGVIALDAGFAVIADVFGL